MLLLYLPPLACASTINCSTVSFGNLETLLRIYDNHLAGINVLLEMRRRKRKAAWHRQGTSDSLHFGRRRSSFWKQATRKRILFYFLLFCSFSELTFPRALIFKTWTRKGINLKWLPLITKSSPVARERWLTSTVDFLVMVGQGLPLHFPSCLANGESFPLGSTHPGAIFQGEIADRNSHWHENISHRKTRWAG